MSKRPSGKVKYLVMTVRSDDRGEDAWHIIDGRRVLSTGLAPDQHVAARHVFRKYQVDKEQKRTTPSRPRKGGSGKAPAKRAARTVR
ncbi:hypothetical protein M2175_004014 [Bradyrhizobium elkanii]|uniref:hypothetical protein n=1 Tax=Bradyrhizobium TaxID=374 RepID=UPI00216A6D50|nr:MULTISPECIES: hypothetical protein [Bradyrhizobium]MCS3928983.1 hypothetical protein [Bradyrhizobium elkanii]MCS3969539.1 hypothetical protein [Bradyrhizobium japonicum]